MMGILTRYLIRAHIGPFLFSLGLLTGLLFLNTIAQRMDRLVGRGLEWTVIGEFLLLSIPHVIALTLPTAVLVSVLYGLSQLSASNEITAMAAGGIRPLRILLPLLAMGALLAGVMFYFNDRILPETNHRLKNLMSDLAQKSPTFQLEEGVVNEIPSEDGRSRYFLRATTINRETNELGDVTIFDDSNVNTHRTIHAERGEMMFGADKVDLYLKLYNGVIHKVSRVNPAEFEMGAFEEQIITVRGVGDVFRRNDAAFRSDREMTVAMLRERVRSDVAEREKVLDEVRARSVTAVEQALGRQVAEGEGQGFPMPLTQAGHLPNDPVTGGVALNARTNASRAHQLQLSANRHLVEMHKKYTLSLACIIFVLLAAPIAIRFPRGGVGMVIGVSVLVVSIYWLGLIWGEDLADRGLVSPTWIMWVPDLLFLVVGLFLARRMGHDISTTRGGGWDDFVLSMRRIAKIPITFSRRREA